MIDPGHALLQPPNYVDRLDLDALFGRAAPLEIDIGCGEGHFLVARAAQFPTRNFLGIERLLGRVRSTARRATRAGLTHVRVLRLELAYSIRFLLPPGSVAAAHLLFPDPWPKRRHRRRRVFSPPFAAALCDALAPGGELYLKTDDPDYFRQMLAVAAAEPRLAPDPRPFPAAYPVTGFERHYLAQGRPIHAARFVRVEPDSTPLPDASLLDPAPLPAHPENPPSP